MVFVGACYFSHKEPIHVEAEQKNISFFWLHLHSINYGH
jgi:hypothetical protein